MNNKVILQFYYNKIIINNVCYYYNNLYNTKYLNLFYKNIINSNQNIFYNLSNYDINVYSPFNYNIFRSFFSLIDVKYYQNINVNIGYYDFNNYKEDLVIINNENLVIIKDNKLITTADITIDIFIKQIFEYLELTDFLKYLIDVDYYKNLTDINLLNNYLYLLEILTNNQNNISSNKHLDIKYNNCLDVIKERKIAGFYYKSLLNIISNFIYKESLPFKTDIKQYKYYQTIDFKISILKSVKEFLIKYIDIILVNNNYTASNAIVSNKDYFFLFDNKYNIIENPIELQYTKVPIKNIMVDKRNY